MTVVELSGSKSSQTNYEHYGFYGRDVQTGAELINLASERETESASAIKSPLGALALMKAAAGGIDALNYTMTLDRSHYAPGAASLLQNRRTNLAEHDVVDERDSSDRVKLTLAKTVELAITYSDGMSTNGLIDYLGGKDEINQQLADSLAPGMELVCDKLAFEDLLIPTDEFQVGRMTTRALAEYYQNLDSNLSRSNLTPRLKRAFYNYHQNSTTNWLYDQTTWPDTTWTHKTGSIVDQTVFGTQSALVDGGLMRVGDRVYAVAASSMRLDEDDHEPKTDFIQKNKASLADNFGIYL